MASQLYTAIPNDVITSARWNNEFANLYNNVLFNTLIATGGSTTRSVANRFADIMNAKDFGCVGDGVVDDYAAMQAAWTYAATNNCRLYIPPGTYNLSARLSLNASTPSDGFEIYGAGPHLTTLKRTHNTGASCITIDNLDNWTIRGFTLDGNHTTYTNGSHGFAIYDVNNTTLEDLVIRNYKNSAILLYSSSTLSTPVYTDNVARNITIDGMGSAQLGILHVDTVRSVFENITVRDIDTSGNPGYAVQFKDNCRECYMNNIYIDTARMGLVISLDVTQTTDDECRDNVISNVYVFNCILTGVQIANCRDSMFSNIIVDMNNQGNDAISFSGNSPSYAAGNFVSAIVKNMASAKASAKFNDRATDNVVEIKSLHQEITGTFVTGNGAIFLSGALRNQVTLDSVYNATVNYLTSFVSNSGGTTNTFEYKKFPRRQTATIASGVIAVADDKIRVVQVDTEAAAATDDLDTITPGEEGQVIVLRSGSSTRDTTVKHNTGNIMLNGAADFTLSNTSDRLVLMYDTNLLKWLEIGRGDNA